MAVSTGSRWVFRSVLLATATAVAVSGMPVVGQDVAVAAPVSAPAADPAAGERFERPDAVSAMTAARVLGNRVEDVSERSETTQVFAEPEGSWTSEMAPGPVRAQDEAGEWAPIDVELVRVEGGFAPRNALGGLELSDGAEKTFARMQVKGRDLGWSWPTPLPAPVVEGATATYRDVVPGVEGGDLVVTATPSGFRHDIVLPQAPSDPVSFQIPVATEGLPFTAAADGQLSIDTKAGAELVAGSAPVMYDARETNSGDPEVVVPVQAAVTKTAAGGVLALTPDQDFLADPETVYPVTIDPTYTSYPSGDTWIDSSSPNAIHPNDDTLRVGTNSGGTYRALIQFGTGPWRGQVVTSAKLLLRNFDAPLCSSSIATRTNRITTSWTPGGAKWSAQPGATSTGSDDTAGSRSGTASCPAADMTWTITSIVKGWADGSFPNYGLRLNSVSEGNNSSYRGYRSASFTGSTGSTAVRPRLVVSYHEHPKTAAVPSTGSSRTFAGSLFVGSARPAWSSSATDDGGYVNLTTEVRPSTTSTTITASCSTGFVASGKAASCTPTQSLVNDTSYVARTRATDKLGGVGPWSAWRAFTTDLTTPLTPVLACTDVADGQWYEQPSASATTCSATAATAADIEVRVNGTARPALPSGGSLDVAIPASGYTLVEARSRTRAGVVSDWARVGFGTGSATLTYPVEDDRSSTSFPVQAAAPPGASTAKIQWRFAPDRAAGDQPDPEAGWTEATQVQRAAGGAWNSTVTSTAQTSTTPPLVWEPQSESGIGARSALVELRVVFSFPDGGSGSGVKSSPLRRVQVVPHAFGGSFPTSPAGPGQVGLFTGEFQLDEADVSVPGYGGALSLGRSHLSMAGAPAGPAGVFGPGWKTDLAGPDDGVGGFSVVDRTGADGSIMLLSPDGESYVYRHVSGTSADQLPGSYVGVGETALEEDTVVLSAVTGESGVSHRLSLTEWDGTKTIFARRGGTWVTEKVIAPEANATTSYAHDSDGAVSWIFAPTPAGVACDPTSQEPGCRALRLHYTGVATASGEQKRLERVDLHIFDPRPTATGEPGTGAGMSTVTVAQYAYDDAGRLDATWDPRLGTGAAALKTTYDYDTVAGHTVLTSLTEPGLKPWMLHHDPDTGRLTHITRPQDAAVAGAGAGDAATWTIRYDLPRSGSGLPDLTGSATTTWGQSAADAPVAGAAVFGPDRVPAAAPSGDDYEYANLSYWTESGRVTNTAAYGAGAWQIDSTRYDTHGNTVWTLDAAGRAQALAEGETAGESAGAGDKYATHTVYNADGDRVEEAWSPTRDFVLADGTPFTGRTVTRTVYDDEPEAAGLLDGRPDPDSGEVPDGGFDLAVRELVSTTDKAAPGAEGSWLETEETRYRYDSVQPGDGDGWTLRTPTRVSTQDSSAASGWSTTLTRFDAEGKTIETRTPQAVASTGTAASARTMQTVYYTANDSAARDECDNKPQWAGETCWHGPAGQPGSGHPIPAFTTTGYSMLLAPTRVVEASGAAKRTTVTGYDAAGRTTSAAVTTVDLETQDRPVAETTTGYSPDTGLPTSVSNGSQTQTTDYDTWGRVVSQTDGTGNTATTSYDTAGRVATAHDGKGTYTYGYNGTDARGDKERRGLVTSLDVGLPTGPDEFTGAYDAAGNLVEQHYPGGVTATWNRDHTGQVTGLSYQHGTGDDAETLLSWTHVLDREGRVRKDDGPGSLRSYRYDDRDRLTHVQDTPISGTGCVTRTYQFSDDSTRTSLTSYDPATGANEGACQETTAASTVASTFDDADRITSPGYTYDALGRTKTVPAADTTTTLEAPGNLTVGYHANDMVATLGQTGQRDGASVTESQDFTLDASGRISVIKNLTDAVSLAEATNHYDGGGDNPAWTETKTRPDASTSWVTNWSRNVTTLAGDLGIIEDSDGSADIQLANPHGDVVSEMEIGDGTIASYAETDEYGIPSASPAAADRYGWLGAKQRHSAGIVGGLTLMGVRLYNPGTGRFLTRDPVEGGNDNTYSYPTDPRNMYDLDGRCAKGFGWVCKSIKKVKRIAKAGYRVVKKHRSTILTVGAILACTVFGFVVCLTAGVAASFVSTQQKYGGVKSRAAQKHLAKGVILAGMGAGLGKGLDKVYQFAGRPKHWTNYKAQLFTGIAFLGLAPRHRRRAV